jgi:hypothetical protein
MHITFACVFVGNVCWCDSFHHQEALITLGAKYAPCMRKDKELQRLLDKERREEADTGCCIGTDQNGCIQTSQDKCKVGGSYTNYFHKGLYYF